MAAEEADGLGGEPLLLVAAQPGGIGWIEAEWERDGEERVTYLLTFACYGGHLHGEESGSVDRKHNLYGGRVVESDAKRLNTERELMDQARYSMDSRRRETVLAALKERCLACGWELLAAHVRSSHVHVVVAAEVRPERVMNDLKSFASRRLNESGADEAGRKRWARHGSTRWLWKRGDVCAAVRYVVDGQGEAMAVFEKAEEALGAAPPLGWGLPDQLEG